MQHCPLSHLSLSGDPGAALSGLERLLCRPCDAAEIQKWIHAVNPPAHASQTYVSWSRPRMPVYDVAQEQHALAVHPHVAWSIACSVVATRSGQQPLVCGTCGTHKCIAPLHATGNTPRGLRWPNLKLSFSAKSHSSGKLGGTIFHQGHMIRSCSAHLHCWWQGFQLLCRGV